MNSRCPAKAGERDGTPIDPQERERERDIARTHTHTHTRIAMSVASYPYHAAVGMMGCESLARVRM